MELGRVRALDVSHCHGEDCRVLGGRTADEHRMSEAEI